VLTEQECGLLKLACRFVAQRDLITTAAAADRFRRNPDLLATLAVQISEFGRPADVLDDKGNVVKKGEAVNLAEPLAVLAESITPIKPSITPVPAPASMPESDETTTEP